MKTVDHLLLGVYLLARHQNPPLQSHRRAFLLGCIAPDYNLLSYLRRMPHGEKFRGHNAENSFGCLMRGIAELHETGLRSTWDYFRLGTLLHYAAVAFTAPHNRFWHGTLREHLAYEQALHAKFPAALLQGHMLGYSGFVSLHEEYCAEAHGMDTDCQYILTACTALLQQCLFRTVEMKGVCHESSDHNRLVPASH